MYLEGRYSASFTPPSTLLGTEQVINNGWLMDLFA